MKKKRTNQVINIKCSVRHNKVTPVGFYDMIHHFCSVKGLVIYFRLQLENPRFITKMEIESHITIFWVNPIVQPPISQYVNQLI